MRSVAEASPTQRPHVRLISDDTDFLVIYSFTLAAAGYEVESCGADVRSDGEQCPHVAVIDVLGETDWTTVVSLTARGVRVIVVTGFFFGDRRYRDRAAAVGASAFILKPFRWQTLHGVIARVLQGERGVEVTVDASM